MESANEIWAKSLKIFFDIERPPLDFSVFYFSVFLRAKLIIELKEAQTIKSTVQNIGAAVDQRKKYRTQNEHEIYLSIFI